MKTKTRKVITPPWKLLFISGHHRGIEKKLKAFREQETGQSSNKGIYDVPDT